ncbi:uncharacterized protein LOC144635762 [Oculina patagonica]
MSEADEPKKKQARLERSEKPNDQTATQKNLLQQLEQLHNMLTKILAEAQENARESIEDFVADKVRKMGAMIGHYFNAFQALNVMSRKGVDEAVAKMYRSQSIQDAAEDLLQAEDDWNTFLEETDVKMDPSCNTTTEDLVVGSHGPCELKVTEVSSGRDFSIQDLLTSTSTVLILLRHFA